ncbi:hypothetical protein BABINDRAFT_169539 [Babjeviella inositovora NRRL Y-12698]|uniref:Uncharacterized protein n=1 Tax=Babjeviella inositovora NRRL Y-12698 TaxID=984486 RepID=A0A1E3QGT8_9ASCO|nr:uncharacterized protein BABINDRAFT_169539 [Babjeviella inositovora NRRL Y-12698]ODQ76919.1 hypothetical protein BABINDRAFT_169539 [Babjeviella inositovora NRRL Y-12698]
MWHWLSGHEVMMFPNNVLSLVDVILVEGLFSPVVDVPYAEELPAGEELSGFSACGIGFVLMTALKHRSEKFPVRVSVVVIGTVNFVAISMTKVELATYTRPIACGCLATGENGTTDGLVLYPGKMAIIGSILS